MLRTICFAVLALMYVVVASPVAADDNTEELKKFSGDWRMVSLEANGNQEDIPDGDAGHATFKDDKVLIGGEEVFSIKIDAGTTPRIIDFTKLKDPEKDQVLEGIYKFEDDTLVLCAWSGQGTKSRPAEFATKAGSNYILAVLKRK